MVGKTCVNGCLAGWWTDLMKSVQSGATTAAQILGLYQQGQLTNEQYAQLQVELAKAQAASTKTDNTMLYIGIGAVALVGVVLLTGRKK